MRFLKNAVKSTSKTSFSGGYVKRSRARSWEGAPPKKTSGRWWCSREKKFKKMTSKVPEIKLVKLIIALIETIYTVQSLLWWLTFIVNTWKTTPLQQDTTYLDYLVLVKREKTSWWMFLWLNFIIHQLLITYNSITITSMYKSVSALHSALDFRLSYSWCQLRFFNNASKK